MGVLKKRAKGSAIMTKIKKEMKKVDWGNVTLTDMKVDKDNNIMISNKMITKWEYDIEPVKRENIDNKKEAIKTIGKRRVTKMSL